MKSKLRICAIEPSGRLYGSEYCLLDILKETSDKFNWTVITPPGPFSQVITNSTKETRCISALRGDLHRKRLTSKFLIYLNLFKEIIKQNPDVIYVNQAGILRVSHFIAKLLNKPITCQVQTLEDARALDFSRNIFPNVFAFICNSYFIADNSNIDKSRLNVLYQGFYPNSNNDPPRPPPSKGKLRLAILGRIAESKGHYLLPEVAKNLSSRNIDFTIRVIGEGISQEETNKWLKCIENNNIGSFFEHRGYRSNIREELKDIDLLLIPSIAEPLGRVLFEAAGLKIPVVISDAGGLGEIAKRFDVGVRFTSGDPDKLTAAILQFYASTPEERSRQLANSGRMLAALSMPTYISTIENIIDSTYRRIPISLKWLGDL